MRLRSDRVSPLGTTIFSTFSALAQQHGAVNLGQGFPDFGGPSEVREAAIAALRGGFDQYAPSPGSLRLRRALAAHAQHHFGHEVDPELGVTVTSGATEALFAAILGLVDPGEEVILFEPAYDSYAASVRMAGAIARYVRLHPPDPEHATWWFEPAELRAAFGPKTRLMLLNTPHNPTGKVFTREELELLGELCRAHDVALLSDEVYEHLTFAPAAHVRPATLPDLSDRTVTVGSAGKTLSFTGWKVGWILAPPALRDAVQRAHQFITFCTAAPLQEAVAVGLELPDAWFEGFRRDYLARRTRLLGGLVRAELPAFIPEGSYFALADLRPLGVRDDVAFCRWLTREVGVAAIPVSPFYDPAGPPPPPMARFAFCKTDTVIDAAVARLMENLKGRPLPEEARGAPGSGADPVPSSS